MYQKITHKSGQYLHAKTCTTCITYNYCIDLLGQVKGTCIFTSYIILITFLNIECWEEDLY